MKYAVWVLAGLLATSTAASAADLAPQPVEPAAPAPLVFNWTGFYVGAYAGASFGSNKLKNLNSSTDVSLSPTGFTAGGLAGANYQFDSFVAGAEAEFGYDGWSSDKDYLNGRRQTRHAKSEGSYIGRLRGRFGYAIGSFLIYAAGGISFADDKVTQTNTFVGVSDSIRKNLVGWNAGAGVEYAFTDHWIGRAEYIFDRFGKKTYDFIDRPAGFASRRISLNQNTIRAAVEYKF